MTLPPPPAPWPPQQPWSPPPPTGGGKTKWIWLGLALIAVIGVAVAAIVSAAVHHSATTKPSSTSVANPSGPTELPFGSLHGPQGVAVDGNGNVYIADVATDIADN